MPRGLQYKHEVAKIVGQEIKIKKVRCSVKTKLFIGLGVMQQFKCCIGYRFAEVSSALFILSVHLHTNQYFLIVNITI